jgi:hypothetical protein
MPGPFLLNGASQMSRLNGLLVSLFALVTALSSGSAYAWDIPEPDYWSVLSTAPELTFGGVGVAGTPTEAGTAFDQLLDDVLVDETQALDLLAHGSAAGRMYGAALLWHRDPTAGRTALTLLTHDTAPLVYIAGCMYEQSTVGEIAQRFLTNSQFSYLETR